MQKERMKRDESYNHYNDTISVSSSQLIIDEIRI